MRAVLHKTIQVTRPAEGVDVLSYRMTQDGAMTLLVSFLAGDTFAPAKKSTLADVTASLLDAGTRKHTKNALREKIESLGATIHFFARGNRVIGSLRCLQKDVKLLLPILIEQLSQATFSQKEIAIVKKQMLAQCEEDKSDTGSLALQRLSSLLYPTTHPNYIQSIDERVRSIRAIERSDIVEFYNTYYGRNAMHIAGVGDLQHAPFHALLKKHVPILPLLSIVPPARPAVPRSGGIRSVIPIRDKMTVDVVMGHELPFTRDHHDYYPFMVGIDVLGGGGFTSHLMQTVRERDGLSYHIRAGLSGFGEHDQGNWFIRTQFAPSLYTKGIATTFAEIERFQNTVLTDERIEAKKTELIGSYLLSLGTTYGVASRIMHICDEGKPLSDIDTYPDTIAAIQPDEVRRAIKSYLDIDRISVASAGSIDTMGKPL